MKKISVFGATGSVGINTLNLLLLKKSLFKVVALTAYNDYKKLAKYAKLLNCSYAVIGNKKYYQSLKNELNGTKVNIIAGEEGLIEVAQLKTDIVVSAIVGIAGLKPTFETLGKTKVLAIANKESIISAGSFLLNAANKTKTNLLPLDSEHNAIFQVFKNEKREYIKDITLTASGGPFWKRHSTNFKKITIKEALTHPNWKMGKKISIDSATMVNKVLETLEASILFNINIEKINILIHPSSIVHGIINYIDGTSHMIASLPDMKLPINYALNWPKRSSSCVKNLDLQKIQHLSFYKPDYNKFPSLKLKNIICKSKYKKSNIIVLNASNEVAVEYFLKNKIPFIDIVKNINKTIKLFKHINIKSINDVINVDKQARDLIANIIEKRI